MTTATLPLWLTRPEPNGDTYGTIRRDGSDWILDAEPQVVILAKRLFPGSSGRGRNQARFPANPRLFRDLVWLQHRYPLRVIDEDAWERDYQEICTRELRRAAILAAPREATPPPLFTGTLLPFQREGLAWIQTNQNTLLGDEMGLGKTPQGLAYLAARGTWPVLIVPPPHLVNHWLQKIDEFLAVQHFDGLFANCTGMCVHVIRGTKAGPLPAADIYLCHYLLLRSWRRILKPMACQTIIFDEIQELRHGGTEKYSAASDIAASASSVVGLSGTPIYNRGGEIWHVMNILEYHCLGDWDSFTREWCAGFGMDVVKDPETLGSYLRREGLMLRRRKEDVLPDLPAKRRIVETIDSDQGLAAELMQAAKARAASAEGEKDAFTRVREEREAVNSARQATGIQKAPAAAVFIRGLVEAGEPCLVFAYHHAAFDILEDKLREFKPVRITGHETPAQKAAAVDAFSAGKTDVALISLRAATGLDGLQARARAVVFAELDWSPAVHSQAEDRAHRMGQTDSVLCYYLVTETGTDPDVQEALGLKVSQFTGLMGDTPESEDDRAIAGQEITSHMRKIIARLRGKAVEHEGH